MIGFTIGDLSILVLTTGVGEAHTPPWERLVALSKSVLVQMKSKA